MPNKYVRTLIHIHTTCSQDSNITPDVLADYTERENIGCVCVTDHDSIEGGVRLQRLLGADRVVVGEEISTADGHLIGLFLTQCVPPGQSVRASAEAVKAQGGLVLVPHPFTRIGGYGLAGEMAKIMDLIDAIEINNAQHLTDGPDRRARQFAERHALRKYVGSDSHRQCSISPCWQEMQPFTSPASFLRSLEQAELHPGRHTARYVAEMICWLATVKAPNMALRAMGLKREVSGEWENRVGGRLPAVNRQA